MLKLELIHKNCEALLSQITDELHNTFLELNQNSDIELKVNSEFSEKLGVINNYYAYLNLQKLADDLESYINN
mgnify:FL=1